MQNFKMMTKEMWEEIEEKAEEFALSLVPDTICPACDCLEFYEDSEHCPNCKYPNRFHPNFKPHSRPLLKNGASPVLES